MPAKTSSLPTVRFNVVTGHHESWMSRLFEKSGSNKALRFSFTGVTRREPHAVGTALAGVPTAEIVAKLESSEWESIAARFHARWYLMGENPLAPVTHESRMGGVMITPVPRTQIKIKGNGLVGIERAFISPVVPWENTHGVREHLATQFHTVSVDVNTGRVLVGS